MSVSLTLLGLLDRQPSYGYDLKRAYDTYFARGKPLSFGQVYTTLARLARDGKAIAGPPEHGDGPDRKRYSITKAGMADVDRWLTTPAEPEPHLQPVLFAKVTLALMLGSLVDTMLADYGLFHLEADLRWIDLTAARLSELREMVRD